MFFTRSAKLLLENIFLKPLIGFSLLSDGFNPSPVRIKPVCIILATIPASIIGIVIGKTDTRDLTIMFLNM